MSPGPASMGGRAAVKRWRERLGRFFELEGTRDRIRSMEGLRGLAVALVFFVHYEGLFGGWVAPGTASAKAATFLATVGHTFSQMGINISEANCRAGDDGKAVNVFTFVCQDLTQLKSVMRALQKVQGVVAVERA